VQIGKVKMVMEEMENGILHGDVRAPNFIFKDNSAFCLIEII
jgi:hypothetical protein